MKLMIKTIFLLFVLFCLSAYCALSHEESTTLLREAERCFDDGNEAAAVNHELAIECWRKAVSRYEKVIKEGNIVNGALYLLFYTGYFILRVKLGLNLVYKLADKTRMLFLYIF